MSDALAQYDNPKLWKLDESKLPTKIYVSVPTEVPDTWLLERRPAGEIAYMSGEYEIIGRPYGKRRPDGSPSSRTYTVRRQGVELPLSFTGSLRHAKAYAVRNAQGEQRVNVA